METETQGPPNACREVRHPGDEASTNQKQCTEHFARGAEREGTVETPDGDANSLKKMGVVDGGGLRGSRQSAFKLMILHLKLFDSMFGSQSTVAPPLPTAVNFFASLP